MLLSGAENASMQGEPTCGVCKVVLADHCAD